MGLALGTARLRLRPWRDDDLAPLGSMYADAQVMRFIGDGGVGDLVATAEWLERQHTSWERNGFGHFAVERREDGALLGRCGLTRWEDPPETEVGYLFRRDAWGNGYATEAATAVLRWGFQTLGFTRIIALIHHDNTASQRVAGRLGMRYERDVPFRGRDVRRYVADRAPREGSGSEGRAQDTADLAFERGGTAATGAE